MSAFDGGGLFQRIPTTWDKPCVCWNDAPLFIHDGHCCFREWDVDPKLIGPLPPLPCGHDQQDQR